MKSRACFFLTLVFVGSIVFSINSFVVFSTNVDTYFVEWMKSYGGIPGGKGNDYGEHIQQTMDGGYIITGYTKPLNEYSSAFLLKTDSNGNELWFRKYSVLAFGGSESTSSECVQQTRDGGYIFCGTSLSAETDYQASFVIKTDSEGNEVWVITPLINVNSCETANYVIETFDGSYVIVGRTLSYILRRGVVYLIKIDRNGKKLWSKTYEDIVHSWGYCVQQTTDGGFIVLGKTSVFMNEVDIFLMKTDSEGNELWSKTYGGSQSEWAFCVQQTTDEGYVLVGLTNSYGSGDSDVYLIKTDPEGNKIWEKTYGGEATDYGFCVQQTKDGGYIIGGLTQSFGGGDCYFIKTDSDGELVQETTPGGLYTPQCKWVQETDDKGCVLIGDKHASGLGHVIHIVKMGNSQNLPESDEPCTPVNGWPLFRRDPCHTGYSYSQPILSDDLLWSYQTGDGIGSSPVYLNEKVYVTSLDGKIYCLNAITGEKYWDRNISISGSGSPAVSDGRIYIETLDGYIYCFDAETGHEIWQFNVRGSTHTSPLIYGDRLFIGSYELLCLDANSGEKIWSYSPGDFSSTPAYYDDKIYVGSELHMVTCFRADTGDKLWSYKTEGGITSSPTIHNGNVFIASMDGKVYCLDAILGIKIWDRKIGDDDLISSPAINNGRVYIGSDDNNIYCLNANSGDIIWKYETEDVVCSSPAIIDDYIYVGSWDGALYCLTADKGVKIWSFKTDGPILSSPCLVSGRIYFGSYDGRLYCIGSHASAQASKEWTIMVYLNGDNDLESFAVNNINRMEIGGSSTEINVIALIDRHPRYDSSDGNWTGTRLFKIENEENEEFSRITSTLLAEWGEKNMGDPQTLREFLEYSMSQYSAEHYALIIMDHGGGIMGISCDWTNNSDILSITEISDAIENVDSKINLLGFEACLMNMAEIAYQFREHANVMVASEDLIRAFKPLEIPFFGYFPYDTILFDFIKNPRINAKELATIMIEDFQNEHQKLGFIPVDPWGTLSAIDLLKIDNLEKAINELSIELTFKISDIKFDLYEIRSNVKEFYDREKMPPFEKIDYGFIDLYNFAELIQQTIDDDVIQEKASYVKTAIEEAVIAEWHGLGHSGVSGISIYFPNEKLQYSESLYSELDFSSTNWDEFIQSYLVSVYATVTFTPLSDSYEQLDNVRIGINNPLIRLYTAPFTIDLIQKEHSFDASPILYNHETDEIYLFSQWKDMDGTLLTENNVLEFNLKNDQGFQIIYEKPSSGSMVVLHEEKSKLYLHVYDSEGHHVGYNFDTNQIDTEIEGAKYVDLNDTIIVYVPDSETSYRYEVDASHAEENEESYSVIVAGVIDGQIAFQSSIEETIEKGEKTIFLTEVRFEENKVTISSQQPTVSKTLPIEVIIGGIGIFLISTLIIIWKIRSTSSKSIHTESVITSHFYARTAWTSIEYPMKRELKGYTLHRMIAALGALGLLSFVEA